MTAATVAWLALGANVGRREAALARLRDLLDGGGTRITASSPLLVTRPVGVTAQPDFLNQVVRCESGSPLPPADWLALCRGVEAAAGRRPTVRWGPRRADVDILLLGERGEVLVDADALRVPHPELERRPFFCCLLAWLDPRLTLADGTPLADVARRYGWDPGALPPRA